MNPVTVRNIERLEKSRDVLYAEIDRIPVYRTHRRQLRPWDRKLPPIVEQEATKRQKWELCPPSSREILGHLAACICGVLLIAILPAAVNNNRISLKWRDLEKPQLVYHDGRVLFAVWIVVHICTALSWWFVWLTEGFEKHLRVMCGLALILFLECIWLDVLFFTYRLDFTLALWVVITSLILVTQFFMVTDRIEIGALFMLPHLACSCAIIVYVASFVLMYGKEWGISTFTLDQREKFVNSLNFPDLTYSF